MEGGFDVRKEINDLLICILERVEYELDNDANEIDFSEILQEEIDVFLTGTYEYDMLEIIKVLRTYVDDIDKGLIDTSDFERIITTTCYCAIYEYLYTFDIINYLDDKLNSKITDKDIKEIKKQIIEAKKQIRKSYLQNYKV